MSERLPRTQAPDRYTSEVERVSEYIRGRVVRGRDLQGLLFDCASQFPGIRLSVFADALRLVHTRGGGDSLRRPQ
jgi:hypothetical protein